MPIKTLILNKISKKNAPIVWTPNDFLDLGSRDAIDKALQRLVKTQELRRIDRGLYDKPKINSLTGTFEAPDYRKVIEAVGRRDQVRMVIDGLTAANDLGLTNIVPGQVIILTDARLRAIKIQNLVIKFKYTAPSKLYWADKPAMRIIQALNWLGDVINNDSTEGQNIKNRLATILNHAPQKKALLADLHEGLHTLPTWMRNFLNDIFLITK